MQQAHQCVSGIIDGTHFDSIHIVYISDKNNQVVQHADGGFDGKQSNKTSHDSKQINSKSITASSSQRALHAYG